VPAIVGLYANDAFDYNRIYNEQQAKSLSHVSVAYCTVEGLSLHSRVFKAGETFIKMLITYVLGLRMLTTFFLSRVSIGLPKRDIAILSVRPSVRPSHAGIR